jgi:general L-amino acid transport system permease protein
MLPPRERPAGQRSAWSWRSKKARELVYQALALAAIALLVGLLMSNTLDNLKARGIQSGFDFLWQPAGFDIGEDWIGYDSSNHYWKAFLVGLVNTLRVALVGSVLTAMLGTLLGVGRFSRNALVRGLCYSYVELFRNIPVLLQLLMWYLLLTEYLPPVDDALHVAHAVFLSKNGISLTEGGSALSPEYLAVTLGLVLYTSAFVAEVVRGGIASVSLGQHEASASLGLSRLQSMRLVVLPQALRVILPPMANQFLNLTKNSSLAVAVGYPDVVSIANTSLNQTGRALECIAIIMLVYLSTSLTTSGVMNWLNARAAIQER